MVSDADGAFVIPQAPVGTYEATVEAHIMPAARVREAVSAVGGN